MLRNKIFSMISMVGMLFCVQSGFAQNVPTLVKDIAPGAAGSDPQNFFAANNAVYFTTTTGELFTRTDFFKTDGTVAGTHLFAYTPPPNMTLVKAVVANGQWYVLLTDNTTHYFSLGKTDFNTTTIIHAAFGDGLGAKILSFEANQGKLILNYQARIVSQQVAGNQYYIVFDGNRMLQRTNTWKSSYTTYCSPKATFFYENTVPVGGPFTPPHGPTTQTLYAMDNSGATSVAREIIKGSILGVIEDKI
jgi:hypothetical protein